VPGKIVALLTFDQAQENRLQHVLRISGAAGDAMCRAKNAFVMRPEEGFNLSDEEIVGFEIAMDDALSVRGGKTMCNLHRVVDSFPLC